MATLIGEYEVTIDAKGRLIFPSGLRKQLPSKEQKYFVLNKGFEKHLNMFTQKEWDKTSASLNELSMFKREDRELVRLFNNGANPVELDGSGRILIPKNLLLMAGIIKDVIITPVLNKIEIWSKEEYEKYMKEKTAGDNYAELAERVMGNKAKKDKDVS
jgi:MraZ protein